MNISFSRFAALCLLGTFFFSACSDEATLPTDNRLILRGGVLDIPIISGSKTTNRCGSIGKEISEQLEFGIDFTCVEFPRESESVNEKDWDSDYTRELGKDGWKWAGGESIAYYFEKPKDENCNHDLTMLGWMQATEEQETLYNETGSLEGIENLVFIFGISDELKCGTERRAKE